jgi:hypothetical protein
MMPLLRLGAKKGIYIAVAICASIILVLVLAGVAPMLAVTANDTKQLLSINSEIATLQIQNDQIENFKKVYDGYKPNLDKMEQVFFDQENPINFIKFLESTAANTGVKAKIALNPPLESDEPNSATFQIFANDNFLKILRLTETLEHGPYLIKVISLSIKNPQINTATPSPSSGIVDATFLIKTFSKKP